MDTNEEATEDLASDLWERQLGEQKRAEAMFLRTSFKQGGNSNSFLVAIPSATRARQHRWRSLPLAKLERSQRFGVHRVFAQTDFLARPVFFTRLFHPLCFLLSIS